MGLMGGSLQSKDLKIHQTQYYHDWDEKSAVEKARHLEENVNLFRYIRYYTDVVPHLEDFTYDGMMMEHNKCFRLRTAFEKVHSQDPYQRV